MKVFPPSSISGQLPVSVPLRGIGYERVLSKRRLLKVPLLVFQSPCGELVMKDAAKGAAAEKVRKQVSVPLRGIGYESW
jgi:hypothetical protein